MGIKIQFRFLVILLILNTISCQQIRFQDQNDDEQPEQNIQPQDQDPYRYQDKYFQKQPPPTVPIEELRAYFLQLTNDLRARNNVGQLVLNNLMSQIAQEHSEDMAQNNFVGHQNLRGQGPLERCIRNGYYGSLAQNVAHHFTLNSASKGFQDSPGHFKNAINDLWGQMGVGLVYKEDMYYVTCLFKPNY